MEYLERLCSIPVPESMGTTFIIVVDNPSLLIETSMSLFTKNVDLVDSNEAARLLERHLTNVSKSVPGSRNSIRVRCNEENLGASATRNHGISESAAEYILFLDDDVIPAKDLLQSYESSLRRYENEHVDILGLVGLVRFPRSDMMPVMYAAVLMSYLTFMFEIAEEEIFSQPAWGVTANILYKKIPGMDFDIMYAKTGGGEDVDFTLRLTKQRRVTFEI